jgi:hypothetical protein
LRSVAIAIYNRIKEGPEAGDAIRGAGNFAIHQIKESRADDDQSGIEKHACLRIGIGPAKQECCVGVDHESHECEHIGIDAGQGQPADYVVEQPAAGAAEGASPGFSLVFALRIHGCGRFAHAVSASS